MSKFTLSLLIALLASLAVSSPLFAGERAGAISLSPYIGGYTFDGAQGLDTQPIYGFRIGYDFTDNIAAEGVINYGPSTESTRGPGKADALSYRLDLLYNFRPSKVLVPYVAVGGGGTHLTFKSTNSSTDSATANIGGGLKYFITDSFALRADVRQLFIFDGRASGRAPVFSRESDTMFNWEYSLGVSFLFGPPEKPAPLVCPPKPEPVVTKPMPRPVSKPKPLPPPQPVAKKVRMTLNIEFDYNKATIKPVFHEEIMKVSEFLKKYPNTTTVIEGHTDNRGGYNYNIDLSQRRADSVRDYLIENFGIDPGRLSTKGYGYTQPIASNKTAAGRQQNRRVDAVINTVVYVENASQ